MVEGMRKRKEVIRIRRLGGRVGKMGRLRSPDVRNELYLKNVVFKTK